MVGRVEQFQYIEVCSQLRYVIARKLVSERLTLGGLEQLKPSESIEATTKISICYLMDEFGKGHV